MAVSSPDRQQLQLSYPPELPITAQREVLLDALRDNQVLVVAGETGSGKSTQLPKFCLELGRGHVGGRAGDGVRGMIGHTQPRRLAARTVASRIAEEIGTTVGDLIGCKVRFSDHVSERTAVKVMTDGILLAELRSDRDLRRYDTLIIDEAHERSLNIDFLLGYLTELLPRRPDLKVIITSATIDTERFAQHFNAPVVQVSGRSYPVEVRYRPIGDGPGERAADEIDAIRMAVDELRDEGPGDILVFLSGQREIHDAARSLSEARLANTEILPLYARLSAAEQHRAFERHRGRRIMLATNVAETSITVPGVRYVVDTGTARISRYNRRTKVQRLPIEAVSQASANQRAGRCGRVAPGICIRLFSEESFDERPEFTEPEILRTNLASVILQMASLKLGEVESFPFIEPPDARAVRDAVALLVELGAMDPSRTLTRLGRRLARLPIDPRYGRMLLEAESNGCLREVIIIVAGLSIIDPRERPTGEEQLADELHARFRVPGSDFLGYLRLWDYLAGEQRARSGNQFRRMCRSEFLHYVRVREWQDLVRQLREVAQEIGLRRNREPAEPEAIHRSLLAGLLSHVGTWDNSTRDFRGARGARFRIAPGSVLSRSSPRWVMAGELVETGRLWARAVARIDPSWIEPLAGHLVLRRYGEPYWDRSKGTAMADERVLLYGLTVVAGRPIPLGHVDGVVARTMFIEHALVDGDWDHPGYEFISANQRVIDEAQQLVARTRQPNFAVSAERLADLYDQAIPHDVVSVRHFERWWRDVRSDEPQRLAFSLDDMVDQPGAPFDPDDFPLTWVEDGMALTLSYVFEPGVDEDGVTVHIPLVLLPRLSSARFDWHVPGHRLGLVAALIRTLPKSLRRQLVPIQEHAESALQEMSPDQGPLVDVLAPRLSKMSGTAIGPGDFDSARLPRHLQMCFSIEDDDGSVVAIGRDIGALARRLGRRAQRALAAHVPSDVVRTGMTTWDMGLLAQLIEVKVNGVAVQAYPTLVDEGSSVGVDVVTTAEEQAAQMLEGTRRLLLLAVPDAGAQVERLLRKEPALGAVGKGLPGLAALRDDCLHAAADRLIVARGGPAWNEAGYELLESAARERLARLAVRAAGSAASIVAAAVRLDSQLQDDVVPVLKPSVDDMRGHLRRLVHPGFVSDAGVSRLRDLSRYIEGIRLRLDKLRDYPDRDVERMTVARRIEAEFRELVASLPLTRRSHDDVVELRWLVEELRVSLFAQALGTTQPVSEQRIRRRLAALPS